MWCGRRVTTSKRCDRNINRVVEIDASFIRPQNAANVLPGGHFAIALDEELQDAERLLLQNGGLAVTRLNCPQLSGTNVELKGSETHSGGLI